VDVVRIILVAGDLLRLQVEFVETTIGCPNPDFSRASLDHRQNPATTQAVGVLRIVSKDREAVTVILVQPVFRTEPHESLFVLQDAEYCVLGKALLCGDVVKVEVLPR
jgi:hypothetical protein